MSTSCPIAETTGVSAAETTRRRPSLLNGRRSSTDPPPRAITMTSTAGSRSSSLTASGDLGHGVGALHGDLADRELHCGPTLSGVLDHVALGRAGPAADQADGPGQERQPALAVGVEQALGGEHPLEVLQPGEQLADADRPDVAGGEGQRAALLPELRLGLHHDPGPFGERAGHPLQHPDRHGDRQRHVHVGVAQGEVGRLRPRPQVELHDLALDPQRRHPPDVLGDLDAEQPDRPRAARRWCRRRARAARAGRARVGSRPAP